MTEERSRMRLNRMALAALAGLLVAGVANAQGTGRSLDIQPGGRQNGMGAAGVALADDATGATWWNPAALGFVERTAVELTYAQLVPGLASDVSYNFGTYVQPISGWGAIGVGIVFLSYGESEGTDETGQSTGRFGSNEFSPALYGGTRILPDLAVGASIKYIRIQLAPDSRSGVGSTFGLDLGALYRIPAARLSLGVNVQNLGPSVTFINEDQASPLSRNIKAGVGVAGDRRQAVHGYRGRRLQPVAGDVRLPHLQQRARSWPTPTRSRAGWAGTPIRSATSAA